ncbi:MAG: retropepsin-like domain-containing protein [Bacteroidaceae bacterium]|nr:retropepsin-like domain-containing protein [Bacteroidaceae bacterium]
MIALSALTTSAQSYDERIANAMNTNDWFALDSIYKESPKDSITPFLEVFSRCLIGNRFNRPDISLPAFEQLFNEHSESLGLDNLLSSTLMFATDLGRIGQNEQAATLAKSIFDATREDLDSAWISELQNTIALHTALSAYRLYDITFSGSSGHIPFKIEKQATLMQLDNSTVNGIKADIIFDTGAGTNLISNTLAKKLNLTPLEAYQTVGGFGKRQGQYAIARELKLGDIIVKNVPFIIADMTTGNAEADQYLDCLGIIVGSELMLHLKDLTLDFVNHEITVPAVVPDSKATPPNMCFSSGNNLLTRGTIHHDTLRMIIDTGAAGYGSVSGDFFTRNREYVTTHATLDTIRSAGFAGTDTSVRYRLPNVRLSVGGGTVVLPEIAVSQNSSPIISYHDECNLGLYSLMLFKKIRFNMVDFVFSTIPTP